MKIECPKCSAAYKVNDTKLPDKGANVKCQKCQHQFFIKKEIKLNVDSIEPIEENLESSSATGTGLKKCQECGHDVSSKAMRCPNCGFPIKLGQKKSVKKYLRVGIFLLIALAIFMYVWNRHSAFKTAMTSNDYKEVKKAISIIDDPKKLIQISARCLLLSKSSIDKSKTDDQLIFDHLGAAPKWLELSVIAHEKFASGTYSEQTLKRADAVFQINSLRTTLRMYKLDNGNYPETKQGLKALVLTSDSPPFSAIWERGGYLMKNEIPKDPWGNEFVYKSFGSNNSDYEIISYGADGKPGGKGDNRDICSCDFKD